MNRTDIDQTALGEIREIASLIPKLGSTADERRGPNATIRGRLPTLSNDAVAFLAVLDGHQLSRLELLKRLECGAFNDLSEIFRLVGHLLLRSLGKGGRRILVLAIQEAIRVGATASQSEIVELAHDFRYTRMRRDLGLIDDIVAARSDREALLSRIPAHILRRTYNV